MHALGRGTAAVLGLAMVTGVLSGCAGPGTAPAETETVSLETPTETEVATAPVLSDEEALQIAVETYEEFLAISGNLLNTKGETFDDLEAITTENMAANNAQSLALAVENDFTTAGSMPVVKSDLISNQNNRIEALVCVDYSKSQAFDIEGNPLGEDRSTLKEPFSIAVTFEENDFKVDRSELWTQSDFCSE